MRRFLLFIFLLLSLAVKAQDLGTSYNMGSAKVLNGNIYILSILVGDRPWTEKERNDFFSNLNEAENWLKAQAKRYGKTVNFYNGCFGTTSDIIVPEVLSYAFPTKEGAEILWPIMQKVGYQYYDEFYDWVMRQDSHFDSCLVLIAACKKGVSYAVSFSEKVASRYFTECCMLFSHYLNGNKKCAASIAHEVLHCFGAPDLYNTGAVYKAINDLAGKYFPNDIMHRTSYKINELVIDDFTAWQIGLTDMVKPEFKLFEEVRSR